VEVLGRYSNHTDQGTRVQCLLQMAPNTPEAPKTRTARQVQHRLAPAETDSLVSDYLAGHSVYDLAVQYQVHRSTVSRILERNGVARRYRLLEGDKLQAAILSYQNGSSLASIGSELGVSLGTVWGGLRKAGIKLRPRRGWRY